MAAVLLYQNTGDFKQYVGAAVNESLDIEGLQPIMEIVANNELVPWLGETLWEELLDYNPTPQGNVPMDILFRHAAKALGFLTLAEYVQQGTVQLGNSGMFRVETEDMKSAYKYQENSYRDSILRNGYEALEIMIQYLDNNAVSFPTWTAKPEARRYVINYSFQIRQAYGKAITRHTFETLRSLLGELEQFILIPNIGQDQYDELKAAILADAPIEARLQSLLTIIQRSLAHFLIEEGIRRNWVAISGNQIVQYSYQGQDSYRQKMPVQIDHGTQMKINQSEEFAQRWLSYLICYIDDNKELYPLYTAWLDAQQPAEEEPNELRPPAWEELYPPVRKRDAVVRL